MSSFGATWWGRAWLDALEGIAVGRGGRLAAGKRWARQHRAEDLRIEPGGVHALLRANRDDDPFEVFVGIRAFRDDEWEAVYEAIAGKASHAAALLDGELHPDVVEDARTVEVELLPRPRDLHTVCTCPDEVEPCEHAAAACYLLADALDNDPFVLLLVRGRRRDQVLEGVRACRRGDAGRVATLAETETASLVDGIPVREAWSHEPGALPTLPHPANGPSRPAAWPSDPPAHAPFDGHGLRALVADAARRAWELSVGTVDTGLELDARADLARRTVGASPYEREQLALRSGVGVPDLEALASAWQFGGPDGVRVHEEARWSPPPLDMARARDLVIDAGMIARRVHVSGNKVTAEGRLQFRRSRDGRWYLFTKTTGRWTLAAPPEDDIDELLDHDLGT